MKSPNKPSKRQQWYALVLIVVSNLTLIVVSHAGMPADRRFLLVVGICLLGLFAGSIWAFAAFFRFRKVSSRSTERR